MWKFQNRLKSSTVGKKMLRTFWYKNKGEVITDVFSFKRNWRWNLNCHANTVSKMCDYVLCAHSLKCAILKIIGIGKYYRNTQKHIMLEFCGQTCTLSAIQTKLTLKSKATECRG